jgi:hypothetical protein
MPHHRRYVIALTLLLVVRSIGAIAQAKPCAPPHTVSDVLFHPGDVWTYKTRPEDSGSTLTILKVESLEKVGVVVHVRVDKLHMHTADGSDINSIGHMPLARQALAQSVIQKKNSGPVPDFADGYNRWAQACGGVYSISVSEAVAADQEVLLHGSQH